MAMTLDQVLVGELAPYANQVLSVAGKTVATNQILYASQEDLWSTCGIVLAGGNVPANVEQRLYQLEAGQTGQGFTVGLSQAETNSPWGSRAQGNETYLCYSIGFEFYATSGVGSLAPIPISSVTDIATLGQNLFWSLQMGGGPERAMGLLGQYPWGAGAYAASSMAIDSAIPQVPIVTTAAAVATGFRDGGAQNGGPNVPQRKRATFLPFPPNIDVIIKIKSGSSALNLSGQFVGTEAIAVKACMRGFRVTLPA